MAEYSEPVEDGDHFYRRISLELSGSWPGEVYLRFEPFMGPAVMIRVMPGDIVSISNLTGVDRVSAVEQDTPERIAKIARARHPDHVRDRLDELSGERDWHA